MNKGELKSVIKQLVRESLTEIFAEMNLQAIVEQSVKKNLSEVANSRPLVREQVTEQVQMRQKPKVQPKKNLVEKLGISDDIWRGIYEDTANSANPVLMGEEAPSTPEIPVDVLEEAGLMKDYSKFLGNNSSQEEDEWKKLREQRQNVLNQSVKRI